MKNMRVSVGRQGPGRSLVTSESELPVLRPVSDASVSDRSVYLQVPPCILRLTWAHPGVEFKSQLARGASSRPWAVAPRVISHSSHQFFCCISVFLLMRLGRTRERSGIRRRNWNG